MAAVVERRISRAARWSRRLASFAAVLFVMSGLGHRFGLIDTVSFFWLLGIVGTIAIAALCCAAWGFFRLWTRGDRGGRDSAAGALIALAVAAPFLLSAFKAMTLPSLTDISTDVIDPPRLAQAAQERSALMNPVGPLAPEDAELQLESYPGVIGRRYEVAPDLVIQAILKLAQDRGWTVRGDPQLAEGQSELTLEIVAYTFFLGFPVDVAVRVTDEDAAVYVDMRSVSRWGRHDLGDNARRIERFLGDLDAAVKGEPVAE
ncbi:MAG: DUF1499 domain-containing protein [Mesorhizobium sp.]|nr:DUF1499 domain-containing protein [Mesorhizobium sp.]MCO5160001.1 DUF1499 domain-containing protein [Mesorhizobium sp.]